MKMGEDTPKELKNDGGKAGGKKTKKRNKAKEMNDKMTDIMMWSVTEVTNIMYPAIRQYKERKTAERDLRYEKTNAKKSVFTDRKRTPSRSPGCVKRGSGEKTVRLVSQQSPSTSLARSRPAHLGREFWKAGIAVAPLHQTDDTSSLCKESMHFEVSEDPVLSPNIGALAAKTICSSLSDLLQENASKASVSADMESNMSASAESLPVLMRREMIDYQQEGPLAKVPSSSLYKPLESGEIAEKNLEDAAKSSTQCQSYTPFSLKVSHGFVEDIISRLLSNIFPVSTNPSSSAEEETEFEEFDLIHMKLVHIVRVKMSKDENSSSQHIKHLHSNEDGIVQTIADSVYNKLLTQFQSQLHMQKCLRNGCMILSETLCDLVFQEISGNQLQNSLSGELTLQQCAEADSIVENMLRDLTEPLDLPNPSSSDLSKTSSLIVEKPAANLVSTFFSLFPIVNLDVENNPLVNFITRRILYALQVFLSTNPMKMNENIREKDFLHAEDSQVMGDLDRSVSTSIVEHSDSDLFVCKDLTSGEDVSAHRIAALMAKEVAKHEFQDSSEEETLLTSSSTPEAVDIVKNSLTDLDTKKILNQTSDPHIPKAFVEEIVRDLHNEEHSTYSACASPPLTRTSEIHAAMHQAWDTEDSFDMSELESASEDGEVKDPFLPLEAGIDTAAAVNVPRKRPSFFKKITNMLSRAFSLLSTCLTCHREFRKVTPQTIHTC